MFMKKRFALVALPLAFAGLGACSTYGYGYDDYGYGGGYDDYGYNTGYNSGYGYGGDGYGYGSQYGGVWHDAFYDNHYGPVHGGYWDLDGFFWYQAILNGPYLRDHNRHFRRDYWNGGKHYRYADRRDNHGRDWNDRDRDRNNTYPPLFAGQPGGHRDGAQNRNNNWSGGRDDNDRNRNNDRNNDRARNDDRGRNEGGNRYNPPPQFGGQQGQRANPAPPPRDPQLDGAPRGRGDDRDRNRDRGDTNDRGRGDGGARNNDRSPPPLFNGQQPQRQEPPPQRANPTPPPQPAPQAQPRPRNNDDDGDDSHRGRGRGGDRGDRHDKD